MANTDVTATYADRQYPLVAVIDFDFSTFTEDTTYDVLQLPAGAIITGLALQVKTAWDNTTPVLSVGLTSTAVTEFLSAVALDAEANFPVGLYSADDDANLFTADANIVTVADTIELLYAAAAGTATAGAATLTVEYVVSGRSNEISG